MRRMWMTTVCLIAAASTVWGAESPQRPRLAVAEFEVTLSGRTLPPPDMAASAAQVMVDRLVSSGVFQVFDARWLSRPRAGHLILDEIRGEAQRAGIDYLAFGTITQFSEEQSHRRFGGGALRFPVLGGASRRTNDLVIGVLVKLVNVSTGEIVTTASGVGSGTRTNFSAGGLSLLRIGGVGAYSRGSDSFRDAQLGEAMQRSIEAAARGITAWRCRATGQDCRISDEPALPRRP